MLLLVLLLVLLLLLLLLLLLSRGIDGADEAGLLLLRIDSKLGKKTR